MKTDWILEHNGKTVKVTTEDPENHTAHMAWQKGQRMLAGCPPFPVVKVSRLPRGKDEFIAAETIKANADKAFKRLSGNRRA